MGVSNLPKTVTRQRRGCDLTQVLLRLSPATEPPRLPYTVLCFTSGVLCKNGQNRSWAGLGQTLLWAQRTISKIGP